MDTLRGTIVPTTDGTSDIVLLTTDGANVKLVGQLARTAAQAGAGDVWVGGQFLMPDEMFVEAYSIRAVQSPPATCSMNAAEVLLPTDPPACDGAGEHRRPLEPLAAAARIRPQ